MKTPCLLFSKVTFSDTQATNDSNVFEEPSLIILGGGCVHYVPYLQFNLFFFFSFSFWLNFYGVGTEKEVFRFHYGY